LRIIPEAAGCAAHKGHVVLAHAADVGAASVRPLVVIHVVEEDPECRAVDDDVRAAGHVVAPRAVAELVAGLALCGAVAEGGVTIGRQSAVQCSIQYIVLDEKNMSG